MSMTRRVLLLRLDMELPRPDPDRPMPTIVWVPRVFSSAPVRWVVPGVGVPLDAAFDARISSDDDFVIERQASVWPFDRSPIQRSGAIALLNGDRRLDDLLDLGGLRRYQLAWTDEANARDPGWDWGSCTLIQAGRIASVSTTDANRKIILHLADPLEAYDVPLQTQLYPDAFANAAASGKPKPVTLGLARFVSGTLRDTALVGADAFSYDLHDGPISHVSEVYDRGDLFAFPVDYNYLPGRTGFKLANRPDSPVTANVVGATISAGYPTTWDFENGAWVGRIPNLIPDGWGRSLSGGATLAQVVTGARLLVPPGGSLSLFTAATVLTSATPWRVTVAVSAYVKGEVALQAGGVTQQPIIRSLSTYEWIVQPAGANRQLQLNVSGTDTDITIRSVSIEPILFTARLPEFARAVVERVIAGAWGNAVDVGAFDAIHAVAPYLLGFHASAPITALTVLRQALDSYCGWVTSTRDGKLTVGRLQRYPGGGTVKLTRAHIITVRRQEDTAPGLSSRLAGLRNHTVHSDGEIAGSVPVDPKTAPFDLRAELKSEYTVRTGVTDLAQHYQHGASAEAQPTLIQDVVGLQVEANRVTDLFSNGALTWYEVDAALDADLAFGLEIGEWINVTFPIYGLDAGKWLCLMGATIRFRSRRVTLTLLEIP